MSRLARNERRGSLLAAFTFKKCTFNQVVENILLLLRVIGLLPFNKNHLVYAWPAAAARHTPNDSCCRVLKKFIQHVYQTYLEKTNHTFTG
jgi:hypothetical protein